MTRAALLPPLLLGLALAAEADDCRKTAGQAASAAPSRRAAPSDKAKIKRELARIGIRVIRIRNSGVPWTTDYGSVVSNLADALEGVRGAPQRDEVHAWIDITTNEFTRTEHWRHGVRLLIPHDAPKDALARDIPTKVLEWRIKKQSRNRHLSIHRHPEVGPDSYLDGLENFLGALEGGKVDGDILRTVTEVQMTNGERVRWKDARFERVRLLVPMEVLSEPERLETETLEAWAEGTLTRLGQAAVGVGGATANEGAGGKGYNEVLRRFARGLSNARRWGDPPDMGRLGRVHFAPPGTGARVGPAAAGGRPALDVRVPADAEDPLGVVMDALSAHRRRI